jgi:hypothetical protein
MELKMKKLTIETTMTTMVSLRNGDIINGGWPMISQASFRINFASLHTNNQTNLNANDPAPADFDRNHALFSDDDDLHRRSNVGSPPRLARCCAILWLDVK